MQKSLPTYRHPGQALSIPEVPAGEDVISFGRHNKAIQVELAKKGGCNRTVVKELVSVSFAMRRQDIREHSYHIKDVLKKYSFFKEQEFVSVKLFLWFGDYNNFYVIEIVFL